MNAIKKTHISPLITFGVPFIIIGLSVFFALNLEGLNAHHSALSSAITLDIVVLAPLVYLALIFNQKISKFTVVPLFIIGLVVASFIIPQHQQNMLSLLKTYLLPVVELTVFTLVFWKIRQAVKRFKAENTGDLHFLDALETTTNALFPRKLAGAVRTEIALIYYAFFTWKKPTYAPNEFTYHKESGARVLLGTLLAVALIELVGVHLLLINYPIAAWILTGISAYGFMQIMGLIKSIPRTPFVLTKEYLTVRMGIFKSAKINRAIIEQVELTTADYDKSDKSYQKLALFDHNAILHLTEPTFICGFFGKQKKAQHFVLSVDRRKEFKAMVENLNESL